MQETLFSDFPSESERNMNPKIGKFSRKCAIKGCLSRDGHVQRESANCPKFFNFPAQSRNPEKRRRWVEVVQRINEDSNWMPKKSSFICHLHFISGKHSMTRADPDYVPSRFGADAQVQEVEKEVNKCVMRPILKIGIKASQVNIQNPIVVVETEANIKKKFLVTETSVKDPVAMNKADSNVQKPIVVIDTEAKVVTGTETTQIQASAIPTSDNELSNSSDIPMVRKKFINIFQHRGAVLTLIFL